MAAGRGKASPVTEISDGSPPQSSRISLVASSRPGTRLSGSTPRAKRYWASELMPVARPVWAVEIGSNQALSTKTSVVSSALPVLRPPMTPPRPITPEPSAMTVMSGVIA